MTTWVEERQLLWAVIQELLGAGLISGSSGNASMRLPVDGLPDHVLITPLGTPYREMGPADLVVIDMEGGPVEGDAAPSSETALHLAIYIARGQHVTSVVHTHSLYATVAAVTGMEIPAVVDEMVVKVGGSVRVAEYGFPSSEELAQRACQALGDNNAVLLRNHGLVGVGRNPWEAHEVCQLVERAAQIFVLASYLGKPNLLPPEVVETEQELFRMRQRSSFLGAPPS